MKAVIIGCGAIGSHIAFSLYEYGFEVCVIARENTYNAINKKGLNIQVNENKKILLKKNIQISKNFKIYKSINSLKEENIDYLFIAVKLKNYNQKLIKSINKKIDRNTAVIPPCTNIPSWWLKQFFKNKFKINDNSYYNINNIIGMTMWLSSVKINSNSIIVRHIQRGYPLKAINKKMKNKEKILKAAFQYTSKSPTVKNIYSEIFVKSLNALAFNMAALYFNQNNKKLNDNKKALLMIETIMLEGGEIMKYLKIEHSQNHKQRIKQTLSSSSHTMSMLCDYRIGKEIELKYLWRSFKKLINLSGIKMNYTDKIYKQLVKKI